MSCRDSRSEPSSFPASREINRKALSFHDFTISFSALAPDVPGGKPSLIVCCLRQSPPFVRSSSEMVHQQETSCSSQPGRVSSALNCSYSADVLPPLARLLPAYLASATSSSCMAGGWDVHNACKRRNACRRAFLNTTSSSCRSLI